MFRIGSGNPFFPLALASFVLSLSLSAVAQDPDLVKGLFVRTDIRDLGKMASKVFLTSFVAARGTGRLIDGDVEGRTFEEVLSRIARYGNLRAVVQKGIGVLTTTENAPAVKRLLEGLDLSGGEKRVSIDFREIELGDILELVAGQAGLEISLPPGRLGWITVRLQDIPPHAALHLLAGSNGNSVAFSGRRVIVTALPGSESAVFGPDREVIPGGGESDWPGKDGELQYMYVLAILGNDSFRFANVAFEDLTEILETGFQYKGVFKIVDITEDKVVLYSYKEQMRRTFPIHRK